MITIIRPNLLDVCVLRMLMKNVLSTLGFSRHTFGFQAPAGNAVKDFEVLRQFGKRENHGFFEHSRGRVFISGHRIRGRVFETTYFYRPKILHGVAQRGDRA
jgi:hypothetical protein